MMAGKIEFEQDVLDALGISNAELTEMGLRDFVELVYDKGLGCVDVSKADALKGRGKLEIIKTNVAVAPVESI